MLACHQPQRDRRLDGKPLYLLPQLEEQQQDVGVQLLPPAPLLVIHAGSKHTTTILYSRWYALAFSKRANTDLQSTSPALSVQGSQLEQH
jgi:hypothetical protein